jgi:hypothetical protein
MADDVQINSGLGAIVSTDDMGNVTHVQRMIPTDDSGLLSKTFASDEALILLRRLVKLTETRMAVDNANRQRMNIDGFGGLSAAMNLGTANTVNIITASGIDIINASGELVYALENSRFAVAVPRIVFGTTNPFNTIAGLDRALYIDPSREVAADSFRNYLIFS